MYYSPGYQASEVGDVDVIVHEDRIHLFHLTLPNHDVVGHLVSDDGLTWQTLPNALTTGDPGSFDDDQIWTMGTFEHEGRFFMLYTALSRAENGCVQRTGLATSDDLVHWRKHDGNPVAEADGRWYEARREESGRVNWRDPFVFEAGGVLHCLMVARENHGPMSRRGCVAHLTSRDGYRWQVRPPLYSLHVSYDFEVPTLFQLGDYYYLTGILGGHGRDVYRVATSPWGPWERREDDGLLPAPNHAFRTCLWRDKQLLFHWVRGNADWASGAPAYCVVAPPKEAVAAADGCLVLRPFQDLSPLHLGAAETSFARVLGRPEAALEGRWELAGATLLGVGDPGFGALLSEDEYDDVLIEVEVEPGVAREFGVVLRADAEADAGTFVSCVPGRATVELVSLFESRGGIHDVRGRGRQLVQQFHHAYSGTWHQLRVVARGPLIEAAIDGRVVLSALTMRRRRGRVGVFVEDGRAVFRNPRLQRLEAPPGF